jgi:hypothetical protein
LWQQQGKNRATFVVEFNSASFSGIAVQGSNLPGKIETETGAVAADRLHVFLLGKLFRRETCTIISHHEFQPSVTVDG